MVLESYVTTLAFDAVTMVAWYRGGYEV